MSVQFGRWNLDGRLIEPGYWKQLQSAVSPQGPDGGGAYSEPGLAIGYCAYHTTKQSRREIQPDTLPSGCVLTFDGRLDNRDRLIPELDLGGDATDLAIVAAAYLRWGANSFPRLLGDWALALWNPRDRSLLLARDPIGVRSLYYSLAGERITWCTMLAPLVELAETRFALEEEYLAGWLSFFPAAHLTPYVGICCVPPSSYVRIQHRRRTTTKYWEFDSAQRIRCSSDQEYEEQFRAVFRESVKRRLRADAPILAELSGGMDSSSIVCVADAILATEPADAPRLETVSYYDDAEPAWDERPYFTIVEEQRGRAGCHIDIGEFEGAATGTRRDHFEATPGSEAGRDRLTREIQNCLGVHRSRVLLSGVGGDEFTGGVPTPLPELADLLVAAKLGRLARQLKQWALAKRTPWVHLLVETLREFVPTCVAGVAKSRKPAPWLAAGFVNRHSLTLAGYERRLKLFGPLPSFQTNLSTLDAMRRQISCAGSCSAPPAERRYPYLDRDFLEFVFSISREQLIRPRERRSLMRRALTGIVPQAVLHRKRKAFVARSPRVTIRRQWDTLVEMNRQMISASLGIVDPGRFREALEAARRGQDVAMIPLLRTLEMESWFRRLRDRGILDPEALGTPRSQSIVAGTNCARRLPERTLRSQLRKS